MIAYTRISLDASGEKLGVQRQEAEIREWAKTNGHTILEVFQDNDISATSGKTRPAFNKTLKHDCQNIVVWHLDRLVRMTSDLEKILNTEKNVYQVTAGDLDLKTSTGRALARTIVAWATAEVERKAERQRSKNMQSAREGKSYWNKGNRPFGHNLDGTLNKEESDGLKHVINRIMQGASIADACRDLNSKGLTPVKGGNRTAEWSISSLGAILRNKRICAIRVYRRADKDNPGKFLVDEFPAEWEPIIEVAEFEALQLKLKTKTRTRIGLKRENLLSSIAQCGTCLDAGKPGRTVGQSQYTSSAGTIATYRCSTEKHNTKRADYADDYVRDETLMVLSVPEVLDTLGVETGKLEQLRADLYKEMKDWDEWQAEAAEEGFRPSEYREPRRKHEQREAELLRQIEAAEQSSVFGEDFSWLSVITKTDTDRAELWNSIPLEKRRMFVKIIWESITIYPSRRGKTGFDPQSMVLTPRADIAQYTGNEFKLRTLLKTGLEGPEPTVDDIRRDIETFLGTTSD